MYRKEGLIVSGTKTVTMMSIIGLLSVVLAGCGASSTTPSTPGHVTTITAWLPAPSPGKPIVESSLQFAAALWNKQHPHHRVKLVVNQAIPFSSFRSKLITAFVGHVAPDIAYGASGWPFPEARGGYLAAINQLTPTWVNTVYAHLVYPSLRAQMPMIHGNIYALPTQTGGIDGLWYRKDWFHTNHLPVPNTWAKFLHDAKFFAQPQVAHRYHLVAPFMLAASATQVTQTAYEGLDVIYSAGGRVITHGKVTVNSPEVIKALTFLRSLRNQKILRRLSLTTTATSGVAMLAKGELPMAVDGTWQYIALQQDANLTSTQMQQEFAWIPFPRMTSHSTAITSTTGANNLMVANSPVDKLAAQIVELSLSPTVAAEEAHAEQAMIAKHGLQAAPAVEVPDMPAELKDMVGPAAEVAFVRKTVVPNMAFARQSQLFTYGLPAETTLGHLLDSVVFGSISPSVGARSAAKTIESDTNLP